MSLHSPESVHPWLVWIHGNDLQAILHVAPRLEITKEMRKLGWRTELITYGPLGKKLVQGTEVLCFPRPPTFFIGSMIFHFHVERYVLQNWRGINVILFSQLSALWIFPLRLLRILTGQGPIFVMDTRTVPMEPKEKATYKERLRGQFFFLISKFANHLADGQTAITKRMADALEIPDEQLWGIWPSGVNTERFLTAANKRSWPGNQDPVIVIYIGALSYGRNLMTLCKAIVEANRCGMNFRLWLYGEGSEKKDLQMYAWQASESITVFDAVPNEQIPEVLSAAHVGTLPFPDEEKYRVSSPIKLFEYMGAGLPILATKIACHTDVIGEGDYVFWAEDSDVSGLLNALHKTWQSRTALSSMGQKALSASKNWTWGSSAKHLDSALQYGLSLYREEKSTAWYKR